MNNQIERYSEDHAKRQVADAIIDRITDLKTLTRKQKCYVEWSYITPCQSKRNSGSSWHEAK